MGNGTWHQHQDTVFEEYLAFYLPLLMIALGLFTIFMLAACIRLHYKQKTYLKLFTQNLIGDDTEPIDYV